MKLNKTAIALGVLLVAKGALAQSSGQASVEVYGAFDIGVGHSQHALSDDGNYTMGMQTVATKAGALSGTATTGLFNGGIGGSFFGLKGTDDLGDGLKAVFKLETAFNSFDGVISNGLGSVASNPTVAGRVSTINGDSSFAGQLFTREATAGLSSSNFGTLTLGRNTTLGGEALFAFDPMGGSYIFSPFGYSGSYSGGGFTEDARLDSSLKYLLKTSSGINFGALYKFGGQTGSTNAQSAYQLTAGYAAGPFAIQGAYSSVRDAISATNSSTGVYGAVSITAADTEAFILSARYQGSNWKVSGGYERVTFNNPSNPTLDLGVTSTLGYPVSSVSVTAYKNEKQLDVYYIGANYDFTPTLTGKIAFYDVKQNDYTVGGCLSTTATPAATCSGTNKFYSVMGVYKLSTRTQVYAGWLYNQLDGGFTSGITNGNTSNNFVGTGIRHAF